MTRLFIFGSLLCLASFANAQGPPNRSRPLPPGMNIQADPPPQTKREDLTGELGQDTVQNLTAKLMQFQGKLDPQTLEKLLAEMKNNPGMSQQDLLKKLAGQQSGLSPEQLQKFMPMFNDPEFLTKLKGMTGGPGFDGKLPADKFAELLKNLNKGSGDIKMPEIPKIGSIKTPDMKLPEMTAPKISIPEVSMPKVGSMPNVPNMPNMGKMPNMPNISPTAQRMMELWEKNVGPLSDSPAAKSLIQNMFKSSYDANGMPTGFFDFMEKGGYSGKGFGEWLSSPSGASWKFPSWLGGGDGGSSSGGSSFWNWGGGSTPNTPNLEAPDVKGGSWWSVVLFMLVAGGGLVLWWLWPKLMAEKNAAGPKLEPLLAAIDPNAIIDRETLVKVFEELSVRMCGEDAKMWTYSVIADALKEFIASNPSAADRLAMLYALARYTPPSDTMPTTTITEARTHVGTIAGAGTV